MAKVIQIALHGNNVLTETDPDKFALFADQLVDYILIKEKARGTVSVPNGFSGTPIAHGLSYVPFCLAFVEVTPGVWRKIYSAPIDGSGFFFEVTTSDLVIHNESGVTKNFSFYIFYDNIT